VSRGLFFLIILIALSACRESGVEPGAAKAEVRHEARQVELVDPDWTVYDGFVPAIFRDYGPLYPREGEWARESNRRPWSAWWFPIKEKTLFEARNGDLSPLEKYDRYVREFHLVEARAAEYEERYLFNVEAEGWEGHCHAWALASLLRPLPVVEIVRAGISFTPFDQKALLIKSFERYVPRYYGVTYQSPNASDWSNIQPHLFHRFVEAELLERGRPFVMNKVPGLEIWNVPVWKASTRVWRSAAAQNSYDVETIVVSAAALDSPDDPRDFVPDVTVLKYRLFTSRDRYDREVAIGGEWLELSRDFHPSVLIPVPEQEPAHQSRNEELRTEWVDELLAP
jgi:hypothetical protein